MRATSEHELKLDAPAGFRLPPLGGSPLTPRVFTSVYYDVPGGSLADGGITLRRRTENGHGVWQLKLPADDSRLELEAEGGPGQPPEALLALLHAHLRRGPLERVAELRTHRSGELVARNGTTAEVTADEVTVLDSSEASNHFVEVEIELREGDPEGLDEIADELVSRGRRAGRRPAEAVPGARPHVLRTARLSVSSRSCSAACAPSCARSSGTIRARASAAIPRASTTCASAFAACARCCAQDRSSSRPTPRELDERLKLLGQILGEVRDLDVLLARLDAEAAELGGEDAKRAGALLAALRTERSCSRSRLLAALRSDQYLALLDDTARTIEELEPSGSAVTLDELADEAFARLRRAVRKLPDAPADEELHAVRKKGKRARYAAELAGQKQLVKQAKKLQDVLGEHQDAVVAAERLRSLAVAAAPEQALAAGRLVEREEERRLEARAALAEGVEEAPQARSDGRPRRGRARRAGRRRWCSCTGRSTTTGASRRASATRASPTRRARCARSRRRRVFAASSSTSSARRATSTPRAGRRPSATGGCGPLEEGEFEPHAEVDEIRWETPEDAAELLTWARDLPLLERL